MLKDLFTTRCGIKCKLRALYLALIHPRRLIYRYFSQDDTAARRQAGGNLDISKKSCDLVSIQNAYPMMVDCYLSCLLLTLLTTESWEESLTTLERYATG